MEKRISEKGSQKTEQKSSCGCGCKPASSATPAKGGCSCENTKEVKIDFLYLDLTVCSRCQGTESTLVQSLEEVTKLLTSAGYRVKLNKIHINSIETAIAHRFVSSPTIRVNGVDIVSNTLESECKDCGDFCGDTVDCRDWLYEGKRYTEPPKEMVINAILKSVYVPSQVSKHKDAYVVPENIVKFFVAKKAKHGNV